MPNAFLSKDQRLTTLKLSVVICTHNPRPQYLSRVLDALRAQTFPFDAWELLLIDNASAEPPAGRYDVSWHPAGRHVREDELGLTPARLRGIAESRGDVIVFVDDDNVLAPDYLGEAARIGNEYPFLGAWGAGTIEAEFETTPQPWVYAFLQELAVRSVDRIRWSNDVNDWLATPVGAGQCVRRLVANRYREEILQDPERKALDRRGSSLSGAGDLDLAYTSRNFGFGWGNFPTLCMLHLIPPVRTTEDYMLRISEAAGESLVLLGQKIGRPRPTVQPVLLRSLRAASIAARKGLIHMRMFLAKQRGVARGLKALPQ